MRIQRAAALAALPILAGCILDDPCSPGQTFKNYVCIEQPDGGPSTDGGDGADASDGAGGASGNGMFGAPCVDSNNCEPPAPFCAKDPNQPMGVCTATDCDKNPMVCPADWYCETQYQAFGLPAFCLEK